jgi:hypothetical protein
MPELTEAQKEQARRDWMRNHQNIGLLGLIAGAITSTYPSSMPSWMLPNSNR